MVETQERWTGEGVSPSGMFSLGNHSHSVNQDKRQGRKGQAEVCDPRETSYPGPLPLSCLELEWGPSLRRIHQILGDAGAPIPPFLGGGVRERDLGVPIGQTPKELPQGAVHVER